MTQYVEIGGKQVYMLHESVRPIMYPVAQIQNHTANGVKFSLKFVPLRAT